MTLHPEAEAFLSELAELEIPKAARERYEFLCARFAGDPAAVGELREIEKPVAGRLYRDGPGPLLVWFHGGRFISGSLNTHDALCRRLARALEGSVLAVNYRLAPEHPYPAAFEDARAAADYARTLDENAAAGGDSAGAALALACGLETVALVYPMADPSCSGASHDRFAYGPGPSSAEMRAGWEQFLPRNASLDLPLQHVRRALVVTAEIDPLLDEGLRLASVLPDAKHVHVEGHIHGFLTYAARFSAAANIVSEIAAFASGRA